MSKIKTGGCLCGAVRYELDADPVRSMICSCKNCQRTSGSALSTIALVPKSALSVTGELKGYEYKGDTGGTLEINFCPNCGSPVILKISAMPDIVSIKVGSFDNTDWYKPGVSIFADSAQKWMPELPECMSFPQNPG